MSASLLAVICIFVIMGFVIILSILIIGLLIYGWIKFVNAIFNPLIKKSQAKNTNTTTTENPYINAHLLRRRNDKDYEDYLKWLDETGGDLPIKKILTREEWEFQQQLNL